MNFVIQYALKPILWICGACWGLLGFAQTLLGVPSMNDDATAILKWARPFIEKMPEVSFLDWVWVFIAILAMLCFVYWFDRKPLTIEIANYRWSILRRAVFSFRDCAAGMRKPDGSEPYKSKPWPIREPDVYSDFNLNQKMSKIREAEIGLIKTHQISPKKIRIAIDNMNQNIAQARTTIYRELSVKDLTDKEKKERREQLYLQAIEFESQELIDKWF